MADRVFNILKKLSNVTSNEAHELAIKINRIDDVATKADVNAIKENMATKADVEKMGRLLAMWVVIVAVAAVGLFKYFGGGA